MSSRARMRGLLALSALALACDSTDGSRGADSRPPAADRGAVTSADGAPPRDAGSSPPRDAGSSPPRDGATSEAAPAVDAAVGPADQGPSGLSCAQILQCRESCPPDQACLDQCLADGSPTAQQQHAALAQCVGGALKGSCAASCADVGSAACSACWKAACQAEIAACAGP